MDSASEKRARRIKEQRLQKNMTMQDLAKQIGTATQTVYKYEEGIVTNIPLDRIEKIATVFGVSAAYIAGWSDEQNIEKGADNVFLEEFNNLDSERQKFIIDAMKGLKSNR